MPNSPASIDSFRDSPEENVVYAEQRTFKRRMGDVLKGAVDLSMDAVELGAEVGGNIAGRTVRSTAKGFWQVIRGITGRKIHN